MEFCSEKILGVGKGQEKWYRGGGMEEGKVKATRRDLNWSHIDFKSLSSVLTTKAIYSCL